MSITIVYLLLCLIPDAQIKFSWGGMMIFWAGRIIYNVAIEIINILVKKAIKKCQ